MKFPTTTLRRRLSFRLQSQFPREREFMEYLNKLRMRQAAFVSLQFIFCAFEAQRRGEELPLVRENWPWIDQTDGVMSTTRRIQISLNECVERERDLLQVTGFLTEDRKSEVLRLLALQGFAMNQMLQQSLFFGGTVDYTPQIPTMNLQTNSSKVNFDQKNHQNSNKSTKPIAQNMPETQAKKSQDGDNHFAASDTLESDLWKEGAFDLPKEDVGVARVGSMEVFMSKPMQARQPGSNPAMDLAGLANIYVGEYIKN